VLTEPRDLERPRLKALLERHWGLRDPQLEYLPVGFGSHHWKAVDSRGEPRFVTVDDLRAGFQAGPDTDATFTALDRAYRTAAWLRGELGLEFVVAPFHDAEGAVIRRIDERYAVTVLPLIAGESGACGRYESADERRRMGTILGRLHAASERVPAGLPRREDFALPSRAALDEALRDLDRSWTSGPFAEPTRRLLQANARDLERRVREYDRLAADVHASSAAWVVTHGEPHRSNVIRAAKGALYLVDWDTTLIAPRERDLRMLFDGDLIGWDEYVAVVGDATLNPQAIELYGRWWDLAETGIFVDLFRRQHERTEQTIASWETLTNILSGAA
jgi:spectinomycin phosphotransferase